MEIAKVTSKGQLTVPKAIRDKLDLEPGSKVVFLQKGGDVVVRNANVEADSLRLRSDEIKQQWLAEAAAKYDFDPDEIRNAVKGKSTIELLENVQAAFRAEAEASGLDTDEKIAKHFGVSDDDFVK